MNLLQLIFSYFKKDSDAIEQHSVNTGRWKEQEAIDFLLRLKQVVRWTENLSEGFDFKDGLYGKVFRQTNPSINGVPLYSFDVDYATWNLDDYNPAVYDQLLDLAIEVRNKEYDLDLSKLDNLGKILSFQTSVTTHDGVPIIESQCFVDESDVPPIDTWFYLKRNYYHSEHRCDQVLFCWIPKPFEGVMQQAIEVEILDSYRWLESNDLVMHSIIKNDG
jgi:hypothetical protein